MDSRTGVRRFCLSRGRGFPEFSDARRRSAARVDRIPVGRDHVSFPTFRFCGLYFRAVAASDRELWGRVRAFLCVSRRDAVRRLRRMACPVASRFQCQPCFAAYVPVLAAAPDGAQAL